MFVYVTDTNKHTWAINTEKVVRASDARTYTVIYFEEGTTMSIGKPLIEMVPILNCTV